MGPLRYSINVTLDGCCDHRAVIADEELHRHAVENLKQADALIFGRVTYQMMEAAWRSPALPRPDWMEPFAHTTDAARKYVVSTTLKHVDWNAQLLRGDLATAVQQLKQEPGRGLLVGGVKVALALAELGLVDEYELVIHPRLAGHGPRIGGIVARGGRRHRAGPGTRTVPRARPRPRTGHRLNRYMLVDQQSQCATRQQRMLADRQSQCVTGQQCTGPENNPENNRA